MWETSKRPACSRVHRCSARMPSGTAPASRSPRTGTMRAPSATCARVQRGQQLERRGGARSDRPRGPAFSASAIVGSPGSEARQTPGRFAPPLSMDLRDFPRAARKRTELPPSVSATSATRRFPERQPSAVLWPERFRGGCAFGAGDRRLAGPAGLFRGDQKLTVVGEPGRDRVNRERGFATRHRAGSAGSRACRASCGRRGAAVRVEPTEISGRRPPWGPSCPPRP